MKIALDANGNRVDAKVADKGQTYSCPVCGEKVVPKATISKVMCPHFAHKAKSLCDEWKSDMSEWHYNWQEKFPLECREVVLEKDGVKHRADVLIKDRVIEFQHSPISEEEFNARNDFYRRCGKNLIWIFDMTDKIKYVHKHNTAIPINADGILKLNRIRSYLQNYKKERGYSLFFQENDRLYWIFAEEFSEFRCFNPEVTLSQEAFLKDFGCAVRADVKSISELYREEKEYQERMRLEREESIKEIGERLANTRETIVNQRYSRIKQKA